MLTADETRLLSSAGQDKAKIRILSHLLRKAIELMPRHMPSCDIYQTDFCSCGYDGFRKSVTKAISD
jgi:hypothetical protein